MTAPSSVVDLDDADAVLAADRFGVLRSAAMAGAQIRGVASAVADGVFAALDGLRPRSVVLVAASGRPYRASALVASSVGHVTGVPLVHVTSTPPWVGPLDVVLVAGDDAGDPAVTSSVAAAVRRRAEVVLAVPQEGPVQSAAAGRAIWCAPRTDILTRNTLPHFVAVALAALSSVDPAAYDATRLNTLADVVDEESVRNHPSMEVFDNPAKAIASRMAGRRVVLAGDSPLAGEVARHGADLLVRATGGPIAAADLSDVLAAVHEAGGADDRSVPAEYDPFFHDDELDGPRPSDPVRVFAVSVDADDAAVRRRVSALSDVDVVRADTGDDAPADVGPDGASSGGGPAERVRAALPSHLERALVLTTRLDTTAAYVQVTGRR